MDFVESRLEGDEVLDNVLVYRGTPLKFPPGTFNVDKEDVRNKYSKPIDDFRELSSPFTLHWIFGYNCHVPPINLTTEKKHIVVYAASNVVVMYDYDEKRMKHFMGHADPVTSMSIDRTTRWLATSGTGPDSTLIVWDLKKGIPVHTTYCDGDNFYSASLISPNAKYVVIALKNLEVQFWDWLQSDEPYINNSIKNEPTFGSIIKIVIHPTLNEHIAILSAKSVAFLEYDIETRFSSAQISKKHAVKAMEKRFPFGQLTTMAYMPHEADLTLLIGTSNGYVIFYNKPKSETEFTSGDLLAMAESSVNAIEIIDEVIILGTEKGDILFYDFDLDYLHKFSDTDLGSITGISMHRFRKDESQFTPITDDKELLKKQWIMPTQSVDEWTQVYDIPQILVIRGEPKGKFKFYRDFILSTKNGRLVYANYSRYNVKDLLMLSRYSITGLDVFPRLHFFCIGNSNGELAVWDYFEKVCVYSGYFSPENKGNIRCAISALKYSPDGEIIAVASENGTFAFLTALGLKTIDDGLFYFPEKIIQLIAFSSHSCWCSTADLSGNVYLFSLEPKIAFLGSIKSHREPAIRIVMQHTDHGLQMYSLGSDCRLVIYSPILSESTLDTAATIRIQQSKEIIGSIADMTKDPFVFLISTSDFKLKVIESTTWKCRKVAQAPILSKPISTMKIFDEKYIIYAAGKEIGIQKLPVDGNPYKNVTVIGGPFDNTFLQLSRTGRFVLTASAEQPTVLMWRLNTQIIDVMEEIGGSGLQPYFSMIPGGENGKLMQDIKEIFTYCQVKHYGEMPMHQISVDNYIPFCELRNFLQGLGFFFSNYQLECIICELRLDDQEDITLTKLHFEDVVKIYLNHREEIKLEELDFAFSTVAMYLSLLHPVTLEELKVMDFKNKITRNHLFSFLCSNGEPLSKMELAYIIKTLVGCQGAEVLPSEITRKFFKHKLLGIEEEPAKHVIKFADLQE